MTRNVIRTMLLTVVMAILLSMSAFAVDYTKKGTFRWVEKGGLFYAYDAATGELIRNSKVGKCFVDENGTRYLNQFVKGVYYNPRGFAKKNFSTGWIKSGDKVYYFARKRKVTGYRKIGKKNYFFSSDGVRLSGLFFAGGQYRFFKNNGVQVTKAGWKTIDGKRYYLSKKGIIQEGFFMADKKKYYQTAVTGIVTGEQVIDGQKYYFNANGVYDDDMTKRIRSTASSFGNASDLLFFTKFESGSVGYAQTGGDNGKACGKYQFDYRYALIPFLKYCYTEDPVFFKGFEPFIGIKQGSSSLINNKKLYAAWKACYEANPGKFSNMQDKYAELAYYKPAADYLAAKGIHLSTRPYVIRGAVFSYAIQEGTLVAAQAVVAAKLNDAVSNKDFLVKLYDYRWKDPRGWGKKQVFYYRYTQEKALALSVLQAAGG